MKYFVYAVYDSCSAVYDRPFVMPADGAAVRSFADIACDADHPIGKHPEHYSLHRIGTYDDNTGVIEPENPVCIARAHELVAQSRKLSGVDLSEATAAQIDELEAKNDGNGSMRDAT